MVILPLRSIQPRFPAVNPAAGWPRILLAYANGIPPCVWRAAGPAMSPQQKTSIPEGVLWSRPLRFHDETHILSCDPMTYDSGLRLRTETRAPTQWNLYGARERTPSDGEITAPAGQPCS
ncbi:hypothetical protein NITHO_2810002 [Nitrolancea hollandica Lb]|uniref:Uncharacterized protein n=1 Tax=Nitrolancea hollandica Lb TaxID=1129897 RepID=I4EGU3_9BACT|nr:hypothetical protein NITHO_2810002 [Nitrolancea hollandica Lb]